MTCKIQKYSNFYQEKADPTVVQCAVFFQCTVDTIRKMIAEGQLESYNLGTRSTRVKWESVNQIRNNQQAE